MVFGKKIEKILENNDGENVIMEIDNVLSKVYNSNPDKLSKPERNVVLIEELEREVNNGGFSQYFLNDSGNSAQETLSALDAIGSKIFFQILQNAINKFPKGIAFRNREERTKILIELEEQNEELWDVLDDEFYKYEEDINQLLIDYIKNNVNEFR